MPVLTIAYQDDAERLGLEQAIAYFMQMRQTAQTAQDGTVLAACEQVALNEGRTFLPSSSPRRCWMQPMAVSQKPFPGRHRTTEQSALRALRPPEATVSGSRRRRLCSITAIPCHWSWP